MTIMAVDQTSTPLRHSLVVRPLQLRQNKFLISFLPCLNFQVWKLAFTASGCRYSSGLNAIYLPLSMSISCMLPPQYHFGE